MRRCLLCVVAIGTYVFSSCSKSEGPQPELGRTVMVYMAANNNLAADAIANLNQMEEAFRDIDGKLLVYARIFGSSPKLYEIVYDNSPEIKSKVLKTYNEHDSSDPQIMRMVFDDLKRFAPSTSYGAILWSHATNWFPSNLLMPKTRSFGDDNFSSMDVQELKYALPKELDFLIFDACSMASVEVLYELKEVSPYILASPTEVLAVGMPYNQVAKYLFRKDVKEGLVKVAKSYHKYYDSKSGLAQSATFSLIDTHKLPAVANATQRLLDKHVADIPMMTREGVQRMDLDPTTPVIAFDMLDMFQHNFKPSNELTDLSTAIGEAVVFKTNTTHFLGKPIVTFSGLSSYLPSRDEEYLSAFYQTLSWTQEAGYGAFFGAK